VDSSSHHPLVIMVMVSRLDTINYYNMQIATHVFVLVPQMYYNPTKKSWAFVHPRYLVEVNYFWNEDDLFILVRSI
jgi:hypothetical protein